MGVEQQMAAENTPFWEKPLEALDATEWDALCDGCGKCCLHKLEDEESGELAYTRIACRHLDTAQVRCRVYRSRLQRVPECVDLRREQAEAFRWLPASCSYRLRADGKPLPNWHPLLTGDREAMVAAGVSVSGRVVSEDHVHPDGWWEHVVRWVD